MKITISNNAKIMFSSLSLGEIFMLNETDAERRQRGMTMVKVYIEQEVVSEGIRKYYYKNPPNSSYQEGFDRGLDKAQSVILNAPVADVAPVRCGWWEKHGSKWQCTGCKVLMSIDGTPQENLLYYCPNCGAYMMGENNGKCE